MRNVAISASIIVSLSLALSACGNPMGPIPGGELDGEVKPWPTDWDFSESIENVLVETNPEDPYSVTVWGVAIDDNFYVVGASAKSRWVQNLVKHGYMRLAISDNLYAARATEVTDQDESLLVLNAYVAKYEMEPAEAKKTIEDGGILFRLSPR